MILEFRVKFRDDGIVASRDGHNPELQAVTCCDAAEFRHIHTDERGVLFQLEHSDLEPSTGKIHRIRRCGPLQKLYYLSCCNLFGIEQKVYAHFREQILVLIGKIFLGVYACRRLLAAQFLCQHSADDVHILGFGRVHCNEQIGISDSCLLQRMYRRWITLHRHYICGSGKGLEPLLSFVNDGDVIGLVAEHLGKVRTDFTCSCNHDLHSLKLIKIPFINAVEDFVSLEHRSEDNPFPVYSFYPAFAS